MTQQQNNIQIAAPGFAGLNTQDSPVGMDLSFAALADNCVIDKFGRIASRKGQRVYTQAPETAGRLDQNPAETSYEYVHSDGSRTVLVSGDKDGGSVSELWSLDINGDLTAITRTTGVTAVANNWSYTSLSDWCYMAQEGHPVQQTDGVTIIDMLEQPIDKVNGLLYPDIILSAFGHLFVANSATNKQTVQWSVITSNAGLGATPWTGSGSGLINVEEYWPNGTDEIVALAAHNNLLVIFGRRSILLYTVPTDGNRGNGALAIGPQAMYLEDTIENIGCLARDSVVSIGTDMLFLDASGVRSLNRTIQEKSVPIGDISMNVRDALNADVAGADYPIRAVYSPEEAMYLLILPSINTANTKTYVFDTRRPLENGALRTTVWPGRGIRCGVRTDDGVLLLGREGGMYEYAGGDDTSQLAGEEPSAGIIMSYLTQSQNWDQPAHLKFPKQADVILIGGANLALQVNWYFDFNEQGNSVTIDRAGEAGDVWGAYEGDPLGGAWDAAQYGASGGLISVESINMWGSGKNIAIGFTGEIGGQPVSIQELNIQALLGRIV
jgi:hypothetical protein